MRLWQDEHGEDYAVPQIIDALCDAKHLVDESWCNDVCPKFETRQSSEPRSPEEAEDQLCIWVDHFDPAKREGGYRYYVTRGWDCATDIYAGDDLREALLVMFRQDGLGSDEAVQWVENYYTEAENG